MRAAVLAQWFVLIVLAGASAALASAANAATFREVGSAAAVLYDGPSERARRLFLVGRGTPLEVVSILGNWAKVRDFSGDVLWMDRNDLVASHHVIATTLAAVRRTPQINGELLVQVERGVLLEVVDTNAPPGWVHVRHRDGVEGFVDATEVWGI